MGKRKTIPEAGSKADNVARRIIGLRRQLELDEKPATQADLAKLLKVDRGQVSRWENGGEFPTPEKYMKMATLAESLDDRMWFWNQAIEDLHQLRHDIEEERKSKVRPLNKIEQAANILAEISVIDGFRRDDKGKLVAQPFGRLYVSAGCLSRSGDAVGVMVRKPVFATLPRPLEEGDLAIVDRSVAAPATLVRTGTLGPLMALLLPRTPMSLELGEKRGHLNYVDYGPDDINNLDDDPGLRQILEKMALPTLLFGFLSEEHSDLVEEGKAAAGTSSRLIFSSSGGAKIALTDWARKGLPRDAPRALLLNRATIFGAVVGWMRKPQILGVGDEPISASAFS